MFKIPYSANSKIIGLLQVTKFAKAARHSKTHSEGSATNLKGSPLHARPNQTKDALYCRSGWGKRKRFY